MLGLVEKPVRETNLPINEEVEETRTQLPKRVAAQPKRVAAQPKRVAAQPKRVAAQQTKKYQPKVQKPIQNGSKEKKSEFYPSRVAQRTTPKNENDWV